MSLHIAVFAPATRVMSRKLGPTWRSASPCSESRAASSCGEHVGEHVRQVAEDGHQPVVGGGVDGHRPRAHVDEPVQALVEEPAGLLVRGEVPDGVLERSARVLHPGGLGARDRVPATKRGSGVRLTRSCLVEPTSVTSVSGPDASSAARTSSGSAPTGAQAKHSSAPSTLLDRGGRALDRAALDRARSRSGRGRSPRPRRPRRTPRGQTDRAADQAHAEDGYPHATP